MNCHCIFSSIPVPAKKGKENEDPVSCSHLVSFVLYFYYCKDETPCHFNDINFISFHYSYLIQFMIYRQKFSLSC